MSGTRDSGNTDKQHQRHQPYRPTLRIFRLHSPVISGTLGVDAPGEKTIKFVQMAMRTAMRDGGGLLLPCGRIEGMPQIGPKIRGCWSSRAAQLGIGSLPVISVVAISKSLRFGAQERGSRSRASSLGAVTRRAVLFELLLARQDRGKFEDSHSTDFGGLSLSISSKKAICF